MAANNQKPTSLENEKMFGMADKEKKPASHTLFAKCDETKYKDSNLNSVGKHRCVSKFKQITNLIGQLIDSRRHSK